MHKNKNVLTDTFILSKQTHLDNICSRIIYERKHFKNNSVEKFKLTLYKPNKENIYYVNKVAVSKTQNNDRMHGSKNEHP